VPAPQGNRVLIVTSSGGSAIIATDALEEEGFRLAPVPPELAPQLREFLPSHCPIGNPIDLTGDATATWYRKVLELSDGHYDLVVTIFGDPIPGAGEVMRPGRCELVAYLGGADVEREERARMGERRIAVFPTPERAVKAMARHTCFNRHKFAVAAVPVAAAVAAAAPASLTPAASMAFLKKAALPVTPFAAAANEDEALAAALIIGYPVALKINSPDVTHKTDIGGVVLNVADRAGLRAAFRKIAAVETSGGFRAGGALVCAMAVPGVEVIIGVTRDMQFGHAVMFGLGGTMVEVLKDVSFRIVPFSGQDAAEMIAELRGARILDGVRGAKPADVAALKKLLVQVSDLVTNHPEIEELDLNPVFVSPRGVQIADARIVLAHASAG